MSPEIKNSTPPENPEIQEKTETQSFSEKKETKEISENIKEAYEQLKNKIPDNVRDRFENSVSLEKFNTYTELALNLRNKEIKNSELQDYYTPECIKRNVIAEVYNYYMQKFLKKAQKTA
jgi:hypothetical protein